MGTAVQPSSAPNSTSSSAATQSTTVSKSSLLERASSPTGSESSSAYTEAPAPTPPSTTVTSTEQVSTTPTTSSNSQSSTSAANSASLSSVPQQPPPELMRSLGQLSSPQDYANVMKNYAHDAHTVFYLQSWWDTYYAPYYGPLPPPDLTAAAAAGPKAANGSAASSSQAPPLVEPPPNVRSVIDKLAEYVARNGEEFEQRVSQKGDPRFAFLSSTHEHHVYYRTRVAAERDKRERADAGRSKAREEAIPVLKTPGGRPLLPITAFEVTLSPAFGIRSKTPRLAKTDHQMFADDEDEQPPAASVPSAVGPVSTASQNAIQTTNEDSNATAHSPAAAVTVTLTQQEDLSLAIDGVPLAPSSGSPSAAPSPALSPKDEPSDDAETETGSGRLADRRRKAAEFLAGLVSAQPSVGSAIDDIGAAVDSGAVEDQSSHELHLTESVSITETDFRSESKRRKFHE